jgi:delta(3,5)-delta(2,4)-dienoyl-CoA isomerase
VRSTKYSIKEVDIGLAADIGTLSRLPKIGIPYSWAKEAAYTARIFSGEEAHSIGFVSRVFETKEEMSSAAIETAGVIASKSPIAVQGTKALLDYSRDHTVEEGLRYTSVWNAAMIQAEDVTKATLSGLKKTRPTFEKL